MSTLNNLCMYSWLQFLFGSSFCNQIVTVGEYFGRFGTLLTYSEKTCKYKTKVS